MHHYFTSKEQDIVGGKEQYTAIYSLQQKAKSRIQAVQISNIYYEQEFIEHK